MTDETKKSTAPRLVEANEGDPASVFDDLAGLRKASKLTVLRTPILVNVPVEKPANNVYFRVNPDPGMMLEDSTVIRPTQGTRPPFYYVVPAMRTHPKLAKRLRRVTLALVYTWPDGGIQIWPVPIVEENAMRSAKSARRAFELAQEKWTQIVWNDELTEYDVETAENIDKEPVWPNKSFSELLKTAFADKIIDNDGHPYVLQLRGLLG